MIKSKMYLYIDFELLLLSPVLNLLMPEILGPNFTLKEKVRIQLELGGMQFPILLPKKTVGQYFKDACLLIKGNKLLKCFLNIAHFFLLPYA